MGFDQRRVRGVAQRPRWIRDAASPSSSRRTDGLPPPVRGVTALCAGRVLMPSRSSVARPSASWSAVVASQRALRLGPVLCLNHSGHIRYKHSRLVDLSVYVDIPVRRLGEPEDGGRFCITKVDRLDASPLGGDADRVDQVERRVVGPDHTFRRDPQTRPQTIALYAR